VLVRLFAADIRFINLNDALKLREIGAARFAQPMQDKPSRLLRDADFLGELHRGNTLARGNKKIHRVNPLVQRNVASLEDRSGANREVFLALVAPIKAFLARGDALAKTTDSAARAIRPQAPLKVRARGFLIRKHLEKMECRNGAFGHRLTPDLWREYAPKHRGSQVYNSLF